MKRTSSVLCILAGLLVLTIPVMASPTLPHAHTLPAALSADPPAAPVKLIFIHHSTGGNWLADPNNDQPYGGLGQTLMGNNYFVSATNYGWGPDGIGDRTDIPNWPEWFLGPNHDAILRALYTESGQNVGDFGDWSRLPDDPGGENVIIMFKSCFPNSDLDGSPNDPPLAEPNDWEYSVANAKAVYNALLTYFETRQDKLFVVITAPPLMKGDTSADRALNAHEFNYWLVYDWLADYPYANVAVFDYFNVLTDPNNHHGWNGSEIERLQATENNFAAYPSGDSHPNTAGHIKATAEFVPLLNVAYNRWQGGAIAPPPTALPEETLPVETPDSPPEQIVIPLVSSGEGSTIDNFEGDLAWHTDIGDGAAIECLADSESHSNANALRMAYTIPTGSWGGCGRYFDDVQDWNAGNGVSLWLRTDQPGHWLTLVLFSGQMDAPTPFEVGFEVSEDWNVISIPWDDFTRASWADETGMTELNPARITSVYLSLSEGQGNVWVDDFALYTSETPSSEAPVAETAEAPSAEPSAESSAEELPAAPSPEPTEPLSGGGGLCGSVPLALSLLAVAMVIRRRENRL